MSPARDELLAVLERAPDFSNEFRGVPGMTPESREAAVLILFGELDAAPDADAAPGLHDVDLLLLRRASTLRSHAGQVAFPGGRLEAGRRRSRRPCARRWRRPGSTRTASRCSARCRLVPAPVSNHLVTPVLAWWTRSSEVVAVDHAETVEVFRVPAADLLDPANRVTAIVERRGVRWPSAGFLVAGTLVWGFTGKILDRLLRRARLDRAVGQGAHVLRTRRDRRNPGMSDKPPPLPPYPVRDPGDAWVEGPDGQKFWGRFGAAGLLCWHRTDGILLQHRVSWSHFGGTWGLPGGARKQGEDAVSAAIREAAEEATVPRTRCASSASICSTSASGRTRR